MDNAITVNGIDTDTGYWGYDGWWWGLADATVEALTRFSVKGVVRLTNRLSHFTEYRHTPEECTKGGGTRGGLYCEWWVEDMEKGVEKLNAVTSSNAVWHIEEGGLYLSPDCGHDPLEVDSPPACTRDNCFHHLRY